jgi:hypothetical protein
MVNSKPGCWALGSNARLLPAAAAIDLPKLVTRSWFGLMDPPEGA